MRCRRTRQSAQTHGSGTVACEYTITLQADASVAVVHLRHKTSVGQYIVHLVAVDGKIGLIDSLHCIVVLVAETVSTDCHSHRQTL